jgi:hypothetical protein
MKENHMEHQPHNQEGLPVDEAIVTADRERQINEALEQAGRTGRRIDDVTAKRIAWTLTPGSGPLHVLAETGAIPEDMEVELELACEVAVERTETWIAALDQYCRHRLIKTEMPYWNDASME